MKKKHKFTPAQIQFLETIYVGRHLNEITKLFNRRFRLSLTPCSIKTAAQRRGLKSGYKYEGGWNKKYFEKHIKFLKKVVPGRCHSDSVELFNARFDFSLTERQFAGLCKRHGIKTGFTGYFQKGHVSHNKGKKGIIFSGSEKGWFKSGHTPANYKPVGSERINVGGYAEIKVADPNKWKSKHSVIWEEVHGKIPKGHIVVFLDKDKSNMLLDNLMMVSRSVHTVMCHMDLYTTDKETTRLNITTVMIKTKVSSLKKKTFKAIKNKKMVFLNGGGNKVFVIKDKGWFIPVRETKVGNLIRLRVATLNARPTLRLAQRDLFEYAQARGWQRI